MLITQIILHVVLSTVALLNGYQISATYNIESATRGLQLCSAAKCCTLLLDTWSGMQGPMKALLPASLAMLLGRQRQYTMQQPPRDPAPTPALPL